MTQTRLDIKLVELKLVNSRTKAQELIKNNQVFVNNAVINKPNYLIKDSDVIKLESDSMYVSRAAKKLLLAIDYFKINLKDKTVLDIGSSTGGFSQVCLEKNASKIYAIDVGTNQMDKTISSNKKVELYENTDFRFIAPSVFKQKINFVCCDVSFISLNFIINKLNELFEYSYEGVFLIKPQYEINDIKIKNFNGVIKDEKIRQKIIQKVSDYFIKSGFQVIGITPSPITGKKGNIEYLIYVKK